MARYKLEQKEQTRERIIDAAGRCFKKSGYSGIGVDGLAKEAGVTSGAFYGHFDSKKSAFEAAIVTGLNDVTLGMTLLQQEHGANWWQAFAKFYMNTRRTCDLSESCALQTLTPEVGRAEVAIRAVYEAELLKIIQAAQNLDKQPTQEYRAKVWANLAMLIGGVTLARAVENEKLAEEIAHSIEQNLLLNEKSNTYSN